MANYKVEFKRSVAKDLRVIPNADVKRVLERIEQLAENPRTEGCIKLTGQDVYRVRVGLYRILYEIKEDVLVIEVVKVGHRSGVYKTH
jgi:mRNA interferase RelE/StbE